MTMTTMDMISDVFRFPGVPYACIIAERQDVDLLTLERSRHCNVFDRGFSII